MKYFPLPNSLEFQPPLNCDWFLCFPFCLVSELHRFTCDKSGLNEHQIGSCEPCVWQLLIYCENIWNPLCCFRSSWFASIMWIFCPGVSFCFLSFFFFFESRASAFGQRSSSGSVPRMMAEQLLSPFLQPVSGCGRNSGECNVRGNRRMFFWFSWKFLFCTCTYCTGWTRLVYSCETGSLLRSSNMFDMWNCCAWV